MNWPLLQSLWCVGVIFLGHTLRLSPRIWQADCPFVSPKVTKGWGRKPTPSHPSSKFQSKFSKDSSSSQSPAQHPPWPSNESITSKLLHPGFKPFPVWLPHLPVYNLIHSLDKCILRQWWANYNPKGQNDDSTCFCTAHEPNQRKSNISRCKIIWNSNFSVHK